MPCPNEVPLSPPPRPPPLFLLISTRWTPYAAHGPYAVHMPLQEGVRGPALSSVGRRLRRGGPLTMIVLNAGTSSFNGTEHIHAATLPSSEIRGDQPPAIPNLLPKVCARVHAGQSCPLGMRPQRSAQDGHEGRSGGSPPWGRSESARSPCHRRTQWHAPKTMRSTAAWSRLGDFSSPPFSGYNDETSKRKLPSSHGRSLAS